MSGAVALLKGERKKLRRKEKRARIEQIRVILGLSDSQRTPTVMLQLISIIYSFYSLWICSWLWVWCLKSSFGCLSWSNFWPAACYLQQSENQIIVYLLISIFLCLKPGESLRDFYKRTNMYWQMAAYEHTQHTGKVTLRFLSSILF